MWYDFFIDVPANTPQSNPVVTWALLTGGVIHTASVEFRYGPNHAVGVRILHGGHQVWPTNPEADIRGDGRNMIVGESYPLTPTDHLLKILAYSPGTTYPHRIFVRFGVLPEADVAPLGGIGNTLKRLLALIGVK